MDRIPERLGEDRAAGGGYYNDDEGDHAVAYVADPIRSDYVLIKRDHSST